MGNIFRSMIIAFSMYSIIPMPRVDWEKSNMKYIMCFLPLVGFVIGVIFYLWFLFCTKFEVNAVLYAVGATVLPILINGGIHMDGYIDTCDALCSHCDKDKKLEILKDPRTGAFGVLYSSIYLLIMLGLFTQFYLKPYGILVIMLGFMVSRCLGGIAIVSIKCAKQSGLAHLFSSNADKIMVRTVLLIELAIVVVVALFSSFITTVIICSCLAILSEIFLRMCKKQFGGATGDLIGFYIQLCEITILLSVVFSNVVLF